MAAIARERKQLEREALLTELESHTLAIIRIKTRLNGLVSISTLPPELLANIFQIVVETHRNSAHLVTVPPYAWITLTHVCTHWREIALATPTLWNDIVLPCRPQCVKEILVRSKSVPLVVHHRVAASRRQDLLSLQAALEALPRIRVLKLHLPWETYRKISEQLLTHAPLLQHLVLYTSNMLSCIGRAPPVIPIHYATQPALETLDLTAYGVSWPALASCHNLRHFSIDYAPFMRPTLHTVEEVLNTLRELPLLETVSLSNVLLTPLPYTSDEYTNSYIVELPRLEHLALCGDAAPCASLLDNLAHPSTTRLTLNYAHIGETELPIILPSIQAKLAGATTLDSQASPPFRSVAFGIDFKRSFFVRGWTTEIEVDGEAADIEDMEVPYAVQLEMPRWALEHMVVWDGIPLHDVQSLWIHSGPSEELTVARVARALQQMPLLSAAYLVNWTGRDLTDLLSRPDMAGGIATAGDGSPEILAPKLRHLVLRDATFDPCLGHRERHAGCLRDLAHTLQARIPAGAVRVARVELQKCQNIDAFQIPYMRDVVGEVTWDGLVRISDELETDSDTEDDDDLEEVYED